AGLLAALWGLHLLGNRPAADLWHKVPGGVLLASAVATLERLAAGSGEMAGHLAGGYTGVYLLGVLARVFGPAGSPVVVGVIALVAVLVSTDLVLDRLAGATLGRLRALAAWGRLAAWLRARRRGPPACPRGPAAPVRAEPSQAAPAPAGSRPPRRVRPSRATPEAGPSVVAPGEFRLPPLDLLDPVRPTLRVDPEKFIHERAAIIEQTLADFGIEARVVNAERGPSVTLYELEIASGTKLTKVVALDRDLALRLKAVTLRIIAPLPGKGTVGIEAPNEVREVVGLRDLVEGDGRAASMALPLYLGRDIAGEPLVADLAAMPHLLVAGQTGSGKSIGINGVLLSLLLSRTPRQVRLILTDPKQVEMIPYDGIPHLLCPVITDMTHAPAALDWAVAKMEERLDVFSRVGVRDIVGYNRLDEERRRRKLAEKGREDEADALPDDYPYLVLVIDELGDLMQTSLSRVIEPLVIRIAQKARAAGIHLLLATQRPAATVITGLIKSNLPSRIAYRVASKIDSRIILDASGAEALLGKGDMLFRTTSLPTPIRAQGAYVSEEEVARVVRFLKEQNPPPDYSGELMTWQAGEPEGGAAEPAGPCGLEDVLRDPEMVRAVDHLLSDGKGSVSLLQRRMGIGYNRACKLVERLESAGILGTAREGKVREILLGFEEWEARKAGAGVS
ncbi:MAG: DNA translocase FtsK, partial [Planctomycetes bacterium]|nr:DNA translocase FtsK [Planctomycetota bacterium]